MTSDAARTRTSVRATSGADAIDVATRAVPACRPRDVGTPCGRVHRLSPRIGTGSSPIIVSAKALGSLRHLGSRWATGPAGVRPARRPARFAPRPTTAGTHSRATRARRGRQARSRRSGTSAGQAVDARVRLAHLVAATRMAAAPSRCQPTSGRRQAGVAAGGRRTPGCQRPESRGGRPPMEQAHATTSGSSAQVDRVVVGAVGQVAEPATNPPGRPGGTRWMVARAWAGSRSRRTPES